MKKKALFPGIMAILALLAFVLAVWILYSATVVPAWGLWLLLLIPAAVFGGIWILSRKEILSTKAANIVTGVLVPVFLIGGIVFSLILLFRSALATVTDPAYYGKVHSLYKNSEWTEFFPDTIPEDAENVRFSYYPQFMQGGSEFFLSYNTDSFPEEWKEKAVWHGTKEEYEKTEYAKNGLLIPRWDEFSGAELWLIGETGYNGGYNHGKTAYLLTRDNTVVYYFTEW